MRRWTGLICAGLLALAYVGSAAAGEVPRGYRLEPVVGGLTDPSALDKTPDGRILIAERTTGDVRVIQGGELLADPLCSVSVNATNEGGLLGLAVHPDFEGNGWLYLYYTSAATDVNKVTRVVVQGNACDSEIDILTDLGAGGQFLRNGGGIAFDDDDMLYVATGDMEDSTTGQNGAVLQGKILRVDENGSAPGDNPTPFDPVYAKGIRDGRGLDLNAAGQVYASDRGTDSGAGVEDEVNAVAAGGNLGWDVESGSGGGLDQPLVDWLPTIGVNGLAVYAAKAFPDAAEDGEDNDLDRWGDDRFPGVARTDDDGDGKCVGSNNNRGPCTFDTDCPPRSGAIFLENSYCELRDEVDEWCPGAAPGTPAGDDSCGDQANPSSGAQGVDEPDESFVDNLFMAAGNDVVRTVLTGAAKDELSSWSTFVDSAFLGDCPDGWTDTMEGREGFLYLIADNGGGTDAGGLYRVVIDEDPGPREVSGEGSHFPLTVSKGSVEGEVVLTWEDLRSDAVQPRDDGDPDPDVRDPLRPEREYTVWQGDLGTWYSHDPVSGLDATAGTAVNDAVREVTFDAGSQDAYFLVSGRGDNLEGTTGEDSGGVERPGYAETDLCETIGYHDDDTSDPPDGVPDFDLWRCGSDFTLEDTHEIMRALYEHRGQVIFLDLSAIWCPPCQSEADDLEQLWLDYKDRGVQVLTVLMDEDDQIETFLGRPTPEECRNWEDRSSAPDHTFPCWVDPNVSGGNKEAWDKYDKWNGLPTNVILDNGLRVVWSDAGWGQTIEDDARAQLDKLVGAVDECLQ